MHADINPQATRPRCDTASHPGHPRGMPKTVPYNASVRALTLHRSFHLLASLALLLIVVAPLVSRWQAQASHAVHVHELAATPEPAVPVHEHAAQPSHDHHAHHHDMSSHQAMAAPPAAAPAPPEPKDPHAGHDMGVECDYCLIAARMISLLVALLLLLTVWPAAFRALAGLVDTRRAPALGTLGARGPPLALPC